VDYANRLASDDCVRMNFVCGFSLPLDTSLFNPRTQAWSDHFQWSQDGAIIVGLTPVGRATVEALRLNNEIAVEVRRNWVLV
jgi:hypothetical protein